MNLQANEVSEIHLICGHLPSQVGAMTSHHYLGVPHRVILQHGYPGLVDQSRPFQLCPIYVSNPVKLVTVYLSSRTVPSLGQSGGSLCQSIHLNFCLLPPPTPSITLNVSVSLQHSAFVFQNYESKSRLPLPVNFDLYIPSSQ